MTGSIKKTIIQPRFTDMPTGVRHGTRRQGIWTREFEPGKKVNGSTVASWNFCPVHILFWYLDFQQVKINICGLDTAATFPHLLPFVFGEGAAFDNPFMKFLVQCAAFPMHGILPCSPVARSCNFCNHAIQRFIPVCCVHSRVALEKWSLNQVHHGVAFGRVVAPSLSQKRKKLGKGIECILQFSPCEFPTFNLENRIQFQSSLCCLKNELPLPLLGSLQNSETLEVVEKKPMHKLQEAVRLSSFCTQGWFVCCADHPQCEVPYLGLRERIHYITKGVDISIRRWVQSQRNKSKHIAVTSELLPAQSGSRLFSL